MPAKERVPRPAKPKHDNGDRFDAIDAPFTFVGTTGKKIASFENKCTARCYDSAS